MIVISILFFIYLITIAIFAHGFEKVKKFTSTETDAKTEFSIVIPFRNEAGSLPALLNSIENINYPKHLFEFIFVDDDSTDNSIEVINYHLEHSLKAGPSISIIKNSRNSNSPKKDAITTALKTARNEWIITTDADCILSENWLKTIDSYIQQNECNMIVAPVTYISNSSFLHQFQVLDFLSLQASTISGFGLRNPFLCNGANLAYKKGVFKKVNGFKNNNSIASGDDIFLLEKFLQFDKSKVSYLKSNEAIVKTFPVNTFNELINQRVRWASKTSNYNLIFGKLIGILILVGNCIIAFSPLLVYYEIITATSAISYFLMKLFFDFLLLERISSFYKQKLTFSSYLFSSFIYPYFTLLIVLKSLFSNYKWKGRTFKK